MTDHDEIQLTEAEVVALEARASHAREQIARAAGALLNEASAPMRQGGPLPLFTPSLKHIPIDAQEKYAREMDGSFSLAWCHSDDDETLMAHNGMIASGTLKVFAPADSPSQQLAREKHAAGQLAKVYDILAASEAKRASDLAARQKAEEERAVARVRQQYGH